MSIETSRIDNMINHIERMTCKSSKFIIDVLLLRVLSKITGKNVTIEDYLHNASIMVDKDILPDRTIRIRISHEHDDLRLDLEISLRGCSTLSLMKKNTECNFAYSRGWYTKQMISINNNLRGTYASNDVVTQYPIIWSDPDSLNPIIWGDPDSLRIIYDMLVDMASSIMARD